jgi:ABC-type transport system involved in multi-copper enzyme maturation permease subunit
MTLSLRARQTWTIARLQLGRVFFSRRSFWVYLLAIFPAVIFTAHGVETKLRAARWLRNATTPAAMESVREGDTGEDVLKRAGAPINDFSVRPRARRREASEPPLRRFMMYFDGTRRWDLAFEAGILQNKRATTVFNLEEDRKIYAGVFQYFYLRLAVFFGCLGIFVNLFRGEMLDKTLHFWFLVPARREVLLAGKYLAGLIAAAVIFCGGAVLSFGAMLWAQSPVQAAALWSGAGPSNLFWYAASAALACIGYGSVFLASGMLLKNPIIPAITILTWESINGVLPAFLQKLSVLYYVQSLAPLPPPMDSEAPLLVRLLASPAQPPSGFVALAGLLAVTALVLLTAVRAVRRLEINYSAD